MKKILLTLIPALFTLVLFAQSEFGKVPDTKISVELAKPLVIHTERCWQLEKFSGNNKVDFIMEAVEYSSKDAELLKSIKIILIPDESITDNKVALSSKEFISYIEDSEYAEALVVLNQMLTEFKRREEDKLMSNMYYTTKGGIKFGFKNTEQKEVGYLSVLYDKSEFSYEYYDAEKFLTQFRNLIDIASKGLYLPENAEKLKNAKKGNQEVKDVIIDDI